MKNFPSVKITKKDEETGEFVNVEEDDADADMAEDAFDIDEE